MIDSKLAFYFRIKLFWNQYIVINENIANRIDWTQQFYDDVLLLLGWFSAIYSPLILILACTLNHWIGWQRWINQREFPILQFECIMIVLNKWFGISFRTYRYFSNGHLLHHHWQLSNKLPCRAFTDSNLSIELLFFVSILICAVYLVDNHICLPSFHQNSLKVYFWYFIFSFCAHYRSQLLFKRVNYRLNIV